LLFACLPSLSPSFYFSHNAITFHPPGSSQATSRRLSDFFHFWAPSSHQKGLVFRLCLPRGPPPPPLIYPLFKKRGCFPRRGCSWVRCPYESSPLFVSPPKGTPRFRPAPFFVSFSRSSPPPPFLAKRRVAFFFLYNLPRIFSFFLNPVSPLLHSKQ